MHSHFIWQFQHPHEDKPTLNGDVTLSPTRQFMLDLWCWTTPCHGAFQGFRFSKRRNLSTLFRGEILGIFCGWLLNSWIPASILHGLSQAVVFALFLPTCFNVEAPACCDVSNSLQEFESGWCQGSGVPWPLHGESWAFATIWDTGHWTWFWCTQGPQKWLIDSDANH